MCFSVCSGGLYESAPNDPDSIQYANGPDHRVQCSGRVVELRCDRKNPKTVDPLPLMSAKTAPASCKWVRACPTSAGMTHRGGEIVDQMVTPIFWSAARPAFQSRGGRRWARSIGMRRRWGRGCRVGSGRCATLQSEGDRGRTSPRPVTRQGTFRTKKGQSDPSFPASDSSCKRVEPQREMGVEEAKGEGAVCTAATEPRARWDGLDEVDITRRQGIVLGAGGRPAR